MHKYFPLLLLLLLSCSEQQKTISPKLQVLDVPCKEGGQSNLFVSENGTVYLSWLEYINDETSALCYSTLADGEWSAQKEVARGDNWFVNWADFPSIVAYNDDRTLAAHWLQMRDTGTYDYDVRIIQSNDDGHTWDNSFVLHSDSLSAEHGFVSLLPQGEQIIAAWLDGRNSAGTSSEGHGHGHGGAMSLRTATIHPNGEVSNRVELDDRVCDCCQTSMTGTSNGGLLAYRDRSAKEIRDIALVNLQKNVWSRTHLLSDDGWEIAGCPVNGPSLASTGDTIIAAWFTAAGGQPEVRIARSTDGGYTFTKSQRIDEGKPLGRVDTEILPNSQFAVSWLEQREGYADLQLAILNDSLLSLETRSIAHLDDSRRSGFPRMAVSNGRLIFSWTAIDSTTSIHSAILQLD